MKEELVLEGSMGVPATRGRETGDKAIFGHWIVAEADIPDMFRTQGGFKSTTVTFSCTFLGRNGNSRTENIN